MIKLNYFSITGFILAVAGFVFSIEFQNMAYIGGDGAPSIQWYWLGALSSYVFSIISILLIVWKLNSINYSGLDYTLRTISWLLIAGSCIWTTFIVVAGQSGF